MCVDTVFIKMHDFDNYLRKKVIFSSFFVCLSVCLSVCLLATLRKNFRTDLHKIFRKGWQWARELVIRFWWQSGSLYGYRYCFFRIHHYWEIRKVLSADCAAWATRQCRACTHYQASSLRHRPRQTATTASDGEWYRHTGKACLGGGMHCPTASTLCPRKKGPLSMF